MDRGGADRMKRQAALFEFAPARLPWPLEEIAEALGGADRGMTEAELWRTIPIPPALMIKGKKGRQDRRPAPVPAFSEALGRLAGGDVIAADSRGRWRFNPEMVA